MKRTYPSLFNPSLTLEVWFCDQPCCKGMQFHRDDGPAVSFPDGQQQCWRHGTMLTAEEQAARQGELNAQAMREGLSGPMVIKKSSGIRIISAGTAGEFQPVTKQQG